MKGPFIVGCSAIEPIRAHFPETGIEIVMGRHRQEREGFIIKPRWSEYILHDYEDGFPYLIEEKNQIWEGLGQKEKVMKERFKQTKPFIHNIFFK